MKKIKIKTSSGASEIICGDGAFEQFIAERDNSNSFVVTDSNVYALYGSYARALGGQVFVFKAGEASKNKNVLFSILKKMAECGVTRSWTVIAFGGGVVGDVCALAASLFMRGVPLVQIPTTLLSQVDSSVGGKTAIDFCGIKNVIGSFYQARTVIVDGVFLRTLPARELRCGMGEIIKYAALDRDIFNLVLENFKSINDFAFYKKAVVPCIAYKAKIVRQDERDVTGVRKALNLGHTTGHAFELYYKGKSHGEYVLIGMAYELRLAVEAGVCEREYAKRLLSLINKVIGKTPHYADADKAALNAGFDKKNSSRGEVALVVPKALGEWAEIKLPIERYAAEVLKGGYVGD